MNKIIGDASTAKALAQIFKGKLPPSFKIEQVVWDQLITIEFNGDLSITSTPTDRNYLGDVAISATIKFEPEN